MSDGPPIYEFHALLTTLLGFAGLLFLYRNRMRAFAVLMALPLLLFPLPYYITHAEFRYRVNLDPLLTLLGRLRRHPTRRPTRRPLPAPHPLYSPTTGFLSSPIPSIAIIISSPAFSQRCGVRPIPTPAGVPVLITSPTTSGTIPDRYSISAGIL